MQEDKVLSKPIQHQHLGFLEMRYNYLRQFVPHFLKAFEFETARQNDTFLKAIQILRELDDNKKRKIPDDAPLDFIKSNWEGLVLDEEMNVRRKPYELCLLTTLRDLLRSGEIFVKYSRRYANPDSYLIPPADWEGMKPNLLRELGLSGNARERLHSRTAELTKLDTFKTLIIGLKPEFLFAVKLLKLILISQLGLNLGIGFPLRRS